MRLNASIGLTLAVIGLGAVWGCADGRNQLSPVSPSTLSSSPSPAARGLSQTPLQRADNDGDGYDDPEPPGDAPPPVPDPGQIPPADGTPIPVQLTVNITGGAFAPNPLQAAAGNTIVWLNADLINHDIVLDDGTHSRESRARSIQPSAGSRQPGDRLSLRVASDRRWDRSRYAQPVQLTVNITGSFGTGAFAPNPLQAATGNTIVWLNADVITHAIVLDDGTPVGNLAPGQSSPPLAVVNPVTGYHCTFHPTMVGQITIAAPGERPPDPGYVPPPTDPPADDPGYDYYLKQK